MCFTLKSEKNSYLSAAFKRNLLTVSPLNFALRFNSANSSGWQLTENDTRFIPVGFLPPP